MSVQHPCLLFCTVLCDADSPVCANRSLLENKIAVDRASLTIVDCYLDSNPPVTQVPPLSRTCTVLCCTGVLAVRPAGAPVPPRRPALHPHGRVQQTELQPRPPGAPLPPALDCTDTGQTEYGELLCYGVNSVGQQLEPCRFAMEPAGRVKRCRPCYKVLAGKVARPAGLHCNNGWGQHRE